MASLINQSPRLNLGQLPRLHHSSSSTSLSNNKTFIFKPSWFLVLFLLSISLFTFFLQWRNGGIDPMTRLANFAPLNSPETGCATQVLGPKSLAPVSSVFSSWKFYNETHVSPKICITSTTSAGLEEILPWIFFHKVVGITHFFLFVEGKAASPNVAIVLESIPGVKVLPRTKELEAKQAKSRIWNESWLSDAFHKPCNSALFVKQTLNMEMAIAMARDAGMEWIIHLDTDELLHPAGTTEYSVRQLLAKVPGEVDAVVFVNYEGAVETADIKDPFSEVSLFKRNYAHLPNDTNFDLYEMATRGNPYYFLTYANGKSAARIQDNLRPNGAHRWYNYFKEPKEIDLNEAVVLHYTYAKFSSLTSRRNRCNCQPTEQDVKRCFWLEFDRQAFIVASTETKENMLQWYKDHVVWDNEEMNLKLLKYGVFTRIYTPMVIIQNLQESGILTSIITTARAPST